MKKKNHMKNTFFSNFSWQPIIFKKLKSAIHQVRYNSLRLLSDAYPINDSSLDQDEAQKAQDLQHASLVCLLKDEIPIIRIHALQLVTSIMINSWDQILPATMQTWFHIWLSELTHDSQNPGVRKECYIQLKNLIDKQALSHNLLEKIVDKLYNGLHDENLKVRIAFAELLLACKSTKIPYNNLASIDMIMARIQYETDQTLQIKYAQVISDIFFKIEEEPVKKLKRLNVCLKRNVFTTRTIFYYLSVKKHRDLIYPGLEDADKNLVQFMIVLSNCIYNNLVKAKEYFDKSLLELSKNTTVEGKQDQSALEKSIIKIFVK